ncbi:C2H2 finger domain protein, putative [Talaromyces stipitatus ATCC 10500]|uniref:C2H2 finger domain protein, putative n=1 Tax=Talaromyces stipitatus (strain ATCC 10500 / CBS 375.48 / QM 6759 / NRRL 1006) TaxID=441959 RepID=B8MDW7_TALSN|nr:C2H2 finger domain protein, putative [Talaromyces stipitatus ATCC 10500]EED16044.1 C2H2 finger domain protein, putative [Talaromyces stipitatus ATCC 10500]
MATQDQLNPLSAFVQQAFEDPYLSGPSDLEEFGLEQQHHTPSASSADPPSRLSSLSPADQKLSNDTSMHNFDFNDSSFDDSRYLDFDEPGSTDPLFFNNDMLSGEDGQVSAFPNADTYKSEYQENESQNLLNHIGGNSNSADTTGQRQPQPSRLAIPDAALDNSHGHNRSRSAPSLSPIVKISQVHRGDSPTREDDGWSPRKNKRSSAHLSAADDSIEDSEELDPEEESGNGERSLSPSRAEDGSWIPDASTGHGGVDPYARNDEIGPSPKDLEEQRQRAEKEVDIRIWSASVSVANSEAGDEPSSGPRGRIRSVSAVGTRQDYFNLTRPDDSRIPGPGRLIHELDPGSDFETSSNVSHADSRDGLPTLAYTPEENQLAEQLNRSYPWKDPPQYSFPLAIRTQPESSRSAMQLYEEMAKEMDKVSRVGTWGSRRLNDAEVDSFLKSDSFFKNLSLNKAAIRKLLPKRSSSSLKDKKRHSRQPSFEPEPSDPPPQKKESGIAAKLSRRPSLNRHKSSTHIMAAAIAGTMAASIGSHNSLSARSPVSPGGGTLSPVAPWMGKRMRSKSEGSGPVPPLAQLTIPNLEQRQGAVQRQPSPLIESRASVGLDGDDEEDDESPDDKGIFMDLAPSSQQIVPTLEGFKHQISLLDPRLEPALLQRFATEQLRRYKKLIDELDRHARSVEAGHCEASERCFALGGRAKLLPPRANAKDPSATYCQFQIPGHENSDDDDEFDDENNQSLENSVIPAVFAEGIRIPPVKRLPAEFECSLCFKVKKIQKPSDWTKHIYEDIYPFTCTFPECTSEPKSFKRKADWVRHETERHRHLEWWACSMHNCGHKCFRKNNFVQHLHREHRFPDPTAKKSKGSAASGSGNTAADEREIAKMWKLVEECHHETQKRPEEEPCRFCGNVCKDWRKLMVHLARHMERIALPVLRLAEEHASSTNNKTMNMYEIAPAPAPSISYSSVEEPSLSLNTDIMTRLGNPNISDNSISSPMMMQYDTTTQQAPPHMLSPTINIDISPSGTTYPPASVTSSYLQPHYTPVHRNSMSYPPPAPNMNVMAIRQPTTMSAANSSNIGPAIFQQQRQQQLHVSTIGLAGPQEPLYQSPQDTCFNPDDYLPTTTTSAGNYTSAPMVTYTMTTSPETMTSNATYMSRAPIAAAAAAQMQDNGHTYPPATYHYQ